MAARGKVVITGLQQIERRLNTLPVRIQKRVVNRAMRGGMKLVAMVIRGLAPVLTGLLRANVVVRAGLKRKRSEVSIDARIDANAETKKTSKKTGKTVFYPAIVEYGRKKQGVPPDEYMLRAFNIAADTARKRTINMLESGIDQEVSKG